LSAVATPDPEQDAQTAGGRAARGVLAGMAGRVVFFGAGYLASVLLARYLGPAAYGIYGIVMSVLLWLEQVGKFALPPAAAKLIPEHAARPEPLEQTALFLNTLLFLALFVLLWTSAPWLAAVFDLSDGGALLFRIAALDLPLFGVYTLYRGVLLGHHAFLATTIADVVYSLTRLAAVVVLVTFWLSAASALAANVVASAGAVIFVLSRRSIKARRPAPGLSSPLLSMAVPLSVYMLALQTIGSVDLWLLKGLLPAEETATIGIYVAARNIAIVPSVVFMVLSDVLLPSLSAALARNDRETASRHLQGGVRFLLLVMLPVTWLLALAATDIMRLLYSSAFESGGAYLAILFWYSVTLAFIDLFAAALSSRGEPRLSGAILLALVPVAILFNLGLVPRHGAMGAAMSAALAGGLGTVLLGLMVYRRFGRLVPARTLLRVGAGVIVLAGLASLVQGSGPIAWLAYAGCAAAYAGTLAGLREITWDDLKPFAFWTPRKP
jgi:O-antigen/teichoic acid export membrane protein